MSPRFARPRAVHAGQTLVGLMVGMALSLLTVAAMLALYQAMVVMARDTTRLAQRDGQVASAAMAAQVEMQQAGFGIEPGTAGSNLWVAADGREVVWRFRPLLDDLRLACAGIRLVEEGGAPGGGSGGSVIPGMAGAAGSSAGAQPGLWFLPPVECASADQAGLAWGQPGQPLPRLLASATALDPGRPDEVGGFGLAGARFQQVAASACAPYGPAADAAAEHPAVQLLMTRGELFTMCLPNL
ncbi:hypothetical protein LY625_00770 [Lysobacter sp. GX 14042]|uniref:PilW family protein n=1 Tax=Lysobacter sp. GX 14042 TaxID=2907155 RepID=UPI001F289E02|nr:hypothetical protein [Lysobacter sp. GX 14042]MCE7031172.1 hypothetical protein [Lysobacter sp. GX 14042]